MFTVVPDSKKNMAKNTLALYFRMLFTMFVSLYTSRVVLNALGVSDFGVYNVVGGMVAIFSFLNRPTIIMGKNRCRSGYHYMISDSK